MYRLDTLPILYRSIAHIHRRRIVYISLSESETMMMMMSRSKEGLLCCFRNSSSRMLSSSTTTTETPMRAMLIGAPGSGT
jgi:hypothetical protein